MILRLIPNALTVARMLLIAPFLVCLYHQQYEQAFYLFLLAGFTDALDGWIARTFHWQSAMGTFIDPVADKLLIASSFISLALIGRIPWAVVMLVFLRDITISVGVLAWYWLIRQKPDFKPSYLSKINTVLQLSFVTLCLFELAFSKIAPMVLETLMILTVITTVSSYIDYTWTWGKKACSNNQTIQ